MVMGFIRGDPYFVNYFAVGIELTSKSLIIRRDASRGCPGRARRWRYNKKEA
jgi:hypothetical protein